MEERVARNGSLDVQGVHHFRAGENGIHDVAISVRNSPPLTYENMRQHANGVDRYDLAPNHQAGSPSFSAPIKTSLLPLGGRSRPLPIPIQPKLSPADGRAVILNKPNVPIVSADAKRPPPALNNTRRRPLPQPGSFPMSAAPSTLPPTIQPSSSQSSSLLSTSYASHSRSESSASNAPSLYTTSSYNYLPHSSSSYQTSFSSASRASTLPIATMKNSRDQTTQTTLALPRRAETQPNSAPPYTAGFIIDAAMAPRNMNPVEMAPVENGKAKRDHGTGDQATLQRGGGVEIQTGQMDFMAVRTNQIPNAAFPLEIASNTVTIPSLPPLDFGRQMSPMAPFLDFMHDTSSGGDHTTSDDQVTEENGLGLSGMRREQKPPSMQVPLRADMQLPPRPVASPPIPPPPCQPLITQAVIPAPRPTPVSLQPVRPINASASSSTRKNRPALTVRTWDLDVRPQPKKEKRRTARGAPPLPVSQSGNELTVPTVSDKAQTRCIIHPSVASSKRMYQDASMHSQASFLPSMGPASRQSIATNSALVVPIWVDPAMSKIAPLLSPGMPEHPEQPASKSGGGLTAQLRKMKLLHRKSRSVTEWTWGGNLNVAGGTIYEQSRNAPSAFPSASMTPSRGGLFGQRHPYGYQRGAAACSLNSIGASMPTASGSSAVPSVAPRRDTIHLPAAFVPTPSPFHQPLQFMNPPAFQSAPRPPTPAFTETKKSIGALWTKLRFGTARRSTDPNPKRGGAGIDLW